MKCFLLAGRRIPVDNIYIIKDLTGNIHMLDTIIHSRRKGIYIAEIGLNHNGDIDTALRMVAAAAEAGADAVKFQTFVPELMNSVYSSDLLGDGEEKNPDKKMIDFFRKFVFNLDQYRHLQLEAKNCGVVFFSSVFDNMSLQLLEDLKVPCYKLASSEVTNHPLIEAVALTGKPAVLSTGIASEEDIDMAVTLFREKSSAELVLLHCVSLYPTMAEQVNLARIPALARRFGLPVGFSDHSREAVAPMLAAAVGARMFEKHFTIDRNHDCPDKDISCTPGEFTVMIESVERAVAMAGDGSISSGQAESVTAKAARRSLFARRFIPRGKSIEEDDLVALRPGVGIPAYRLKYLVGKKALVDIPEDHLIRQEHVA
jgi:N,N'-diacetyllegionaminate synthase